ncbi:glutathione S-transferase [Ruegeria pomeroyi]|uniref:glutathione transferase n=1 Tax=Ruegeria pomeroyi TaxID=89184 RepID=A0A9Q3WKY5_9RHOB|nr:glutathione S-transferase [Ruegeria pomeroyi]MCE8537428.1 glutathione S-transferase [Ruegeria pomeroyi]
MITVHHLAQSRSLRILWLLEELGLPYKVIRYERDPKTRLAPPDLRAIHPLGKSPVIETDGIRLAESGAIVDYLCTRHAPQMMPPQDSPAWAEHLELMHFAEGSVMTPILLNLYVGLLGEAGAPLHPRIQSELSSHFRFMEDSLRPSGHFVLDGLSAADILLSFPVGVVARLGRAAEFPRLAEFAATMAARPAFQRALAAGGGD